MNLPTISHLRLGWALAVAGLLGALGARLEAQSTNGPWLTQTNALVAGWNAVYTTVDASYFNLDDVIGGDGTSPIQEIWQWQPGPPTAQYLNNPSTPFASGTQWSQWARTNLGQNILTRLAPNQAYLVRTTQAYSWNFKGRPTIPSFVWTSTGLNFIGFPAATAQPPTFDTYLTPAPQFEATAQIFQYAGGELGDTNPLQVLSFPTTTLVRGQAFWVRSANFNNYIGPFSVTSSMQQGIDYGSSGGQAVLRLSNNTSSNLTVRINLLNSEAPPAGQPAIFGLPPLLLRGQMNRVNNRYETYSVINGAGNLTVTLAAAGLPDSSVEVGIGLNRYSMSAPAGSIFAGILRLTDSTGLAQIDVPVSAQQANTEGLWVGNASITNVYQYLNEYYTAGSKSELEYKLSLLKLTNGVNGTTYTFDEDSERIIAWSGTGGAYLSKSSTITNSSVASPYPLRLILHSGRFSTGGTNGVKLLQRVYVGNDLQTNAIVTTVQAKIAPAQLASARRISSIHFPWRADSANAPWLGSGPASLGSADPITFQVKLGYDDHMSNPFLHTYHPDHDNLGVDFDKRVAAGAESFYVIRTIRISFAPPIDSYINLTTSAGVLRGFYSETLTLSDNENTSPSVAKMVRNFDMQGSFSLNLVSTNGTLTVP